MFDYIAVDFETATSRRDSACAIGIVAVKDKEILDCFYSLIQPPNNKFAVANMNIHGITPDMTKNELSFSELWPNISGFFNAHVPVVAHNAGFDISVLRASTNETIPDFVYVDTLNMSALLMNQRLSLMECARNLSIDDGSYTHHNALDDARLCAMIMKASLEKSSCNTLWEFLAKKPRFPRRSFSEIKGNQTAAKFASVSNTPILNSAIIKENNQPSKWAKYEHVRPSDICCTKEVNANSPLYGKNIVFTGELSIDRAEAMQLAVNAGACIKTSVSRKTNILVVGVQDPAIVGEDGMSSKEERAYALRASGEADISIISEQTFMNLVKETEKI